MWCHFDTCGEFNHKSAKMLAASMSKIFKIPSKPFRRMPSPTQTNAYDCGIYVMAMMEHFARGNPSGAIVGALTEGYIQTFREDFRQRLQAEYAWNRDPASC
jgi:sentrin-specific protease 8